MFVVWRSRSWALAILLCEKYTWALTREWALSVHLAKMGTWALTREWALALESTVYGGVHNITTHYILKHQGAKRSAKIIRSMLHEYYAFNIVLSTSNI